MSKSMAFFGPKFWVYSTLIFCALGSFTTVSVPTKSKDRKLEKRNSVAAAASSKDTTQGASKLKNNQTSVDSEKSPTFSISEILGEFVTSTNAVEQLEKMKVKLLKQYDEKSGPFATARGGGGYGGYGAHGFPSLEGALLSIAFLTFSVFLIDLIQQLLSRFRYGGGGGPYIGRKRREAVSSDGDDNHPLAWILVSHILKSIDNPFSLH